MYDCFTYSNGKKYNGQQQQQYLIDIKAINSIRFTMSSSKSIVYLVTSTVSKSSKYNEESNMIDITTVDR